MHNQNAFAKAMAENPHLRRYVDSFYAKTKRMPEFCVQLSRDMKEIEFPNIIYPVGDPVFVHVYRGEGEPKYISIEPEFSEEDEKNYRQVLNSLVLLAQREKEPENPEEFKKLLNRLVNEITQTQEGKTLFSSAKFSIIKRIPMNQAQAEKVRYHLIKNLVGIGFVDPLIKDPYIEDILCTGVGHIFVAHKIFGMVKTNLAMKSELELDEYCYKLGERIDRPVSDGMPIADGTLPDGSRVSIVFSKSISKRGSSFTIRKFNPTPLSITEIVEYGTLSPEMAAYLWICIENGMSIFICGESASGKTAMLNALCAFIKPKSKIYSCEDTLEVQVPHKCWQRLSTRSEGVKKRAAVEMFDLLKASLRSRPNYILVGEIRGREGNIAFQAMQTGHPCMATFHASTVRKMIQRLIGRPMDVPITFIDNLNVALVMQVVYKRGILHRRVTELSEVEGYSREVGGILSRTIFDWDPNPDVHLFKGMYNSFILEEKVAKILGLVDKREIYNELKVRARIIQEMVNRQIFDYTEVFEVTKKYWYHGLEGLPFEV